jgi:hypothetical protein
MAWLDLREGIAELFAEAQQPNIDRRRAVLFDQAARRHGAPRPADPLLVAALRVERDDSVGASFALRRELRRWRPPSDLPRRLW